ncbi:MAG TPA: PstS family phosphate ABC transporter substrate-binding protein, partial [Phycisphaerales bacterium]|nr:PstS family phosphate ABC transporter substrate-binding protein [Phycisphaerales bacterium]
MKRLLSVLAVAALASAPACGQNQEGRGRSQSLKGTVKIDGSSTVLPLSEAVGEEFHKVAPRVNVTVGSSGTGGGFKRFAHGEVDIADASRPIKKEEHLAAAQENIEYIELPVALDGLTIIVNPRNTWVDSLTVAEVQTIFLEPGAGTWNQVRAGWPAQPIKLYIPGTDSGTFDYFKEVVAGKDRTVRADASASEDDNVLVRGVGGDINGIGFFGAAYYFENQDKLRAVPIDGGAGPVAPSAKTIQDGTYAPFTRPLFIYVSRKAAARPEVRAFVGYYLETAGKFATEVGYVPLPDELYARAKANFAAGKTGTAYLDEKGEKVSGP